jgi:hypothetical protein
VLRDRRSLEILLARPPRKPWQNFPDHLTQSKNTSGYISYSKELHRITEQLTKDYKEPSLKILPGTPTRAVNRKKTQEPSTTK